MHKSILDLLDSSKKWKVISSSGDISDECEIEAGSLLSGDDDFPIIKGVPLFYKNDNMDQVKTNETFSAKWNTYMRENDNETYQYMMNFVIKRLVPLGMEWSRKVGG